MNLEEQKIYAYLKHHSEEDTLYLAIVTEVTGSAYRRPGAKLLLSTDGSVVGNVSSGCVEKDLLMRLRQHPLKKGAFFRYDTTAEEDLLWGTGVGCGGITSLFVFPLAPAPKSVLFQLWQMAEEERKVVYSIIVLTDNEQHLLHAGDILGVCNGAVVKSTVPEAIAYTVVQQLSPFFENLPAQWDQNSAQIVKAQVHGAEYTFFIERIPPPFSLLIFGADEDVRPVAQLARFVGWNVTIVDHRTLLLTSERFPEAERKLQDPSAFLEQFHPETPLAVLVMTHQYLQDKNIVQKLSQHAEHLIYCGIIGPKKRTERILRELAAENGLSQELKKKLYFPTGLDIGSETPEEIAISIIGEILAVLRGKEGGHLKDRRRPIHSGQ